LKEKLSMETNMTSITRRHALALMGTTSLVACAGQTGSADYAAAFQAIASEVQAGLAQLKAVGLSGSVLDQVSSIISQITSAAGSVTSLITPVQGQSTLATIEGYFNQLSPLVAPFLALVPGGSIISLIIAALPAVESLVGMVTSLLAPPAKALAVHAAAAQGARGAGPLTPQAALDMLIARASRR
jgi:hypothetical protein